MSTSLSFFYLERKRTMRTARSSRFLCVTLTLGLAAAHDSGNMLHSNHFGTSGRSQCPAFRLRQPDATARELAWHGACFPPHSLAGNRLDAGLEYRLEPPGVRA